ncbi:hypothetical protein [Stenotrophomonas phage vB_SmeS_BUCT700]|uniref:Uncharacterized protein n=1 Tax=Stenotrophomonas phage vB_SmeS_BUCT700 TaxID=2924895 RepID=A0AAE9K8U7_9CAUD|nr:hypothetical protein [Stenotrophomonas phage vB_SmeS_BUCT700]UNY50308.1 hypothetical protein [Stenotrophomonas phage vB_SmeS_BUCT703]
MASRKWRLKWNAGWQAWEYRPLSNLPPVHVIGFLSDLNRLNSEVTREGR